MPLVSSGPACLGSPTLSLDLVQLASLLSPLPLCNQSSLCVRNQEGLWRHGGGYRQGLSVLNDIPSLTDSQPTLHRQEIPKSATVPQPQFCLPEAPGKPGVGQVEKGRAQSRSPQLTAQGEAGQFARTHPQNTSLKEQGKLVSVTFRRKKGLLLEKVCVSSGVNPKSSLLEILE